MKNTSPLYVVNMFSKCLLKRNSVVTIRADLQQGMETVSSFKINTVTENYWLIYAAAMVI